MKLKSDIIFWKPNVSMTQKIECAKSFIDLYYPFYCDENFARLWYYYKGLVEGAEFTKE